LIKALKDLEVFSGQDDQGRIHYTDGTDDHQVAVVLTEDAEVSGNCWTIGPYGLEMLEAGDIEGLWWPMDDDDQVWGPPG